MEKSNKKFGWNEDEIQNVISGVGKFTKIVSSNIRVNKIKSDPSDNHVLEIVQEVRADFLISGDKKHVLPLKKFGKTRIISAEEFIKEFLPQGLD